MGGQIRIRIRLVLERAGLSRTLLQFLRKVLTMCVRPANGACRFWHIGMACYYQQARHGLSAAVLIFLELFPSSIAKVYPRQHSQRYTITAANVAIVSRAGSRFISMCAHRHVHRATRARTAPQPAETRCRTAMAHGFSLTGARSAGQQ